MKIAGIHIVVIGALFVTGWFSSCKPKHICPAYQSAFYLDQKAAALEFTPFDKDTLPKMENLVRKNDVLLIVRLGKKKLENRMAIIPMITIYPEADSSLMAADSLGADSLAADDLIPEEEEAERELTDSTQVTDEEVPADEATQDEDLNADQEKPADEAEKPKEEAPAPDKTAKKQGRKKAEKDPEISDPGLKFDFEETFNDSIPPDDFQNLVPEEEENDIPQPKNDDKRKAIPNQDADKPKEEDVPADDGKF